MNVHYAKFQKKFDSGTISRELPQGNAIFHGNDTCIKNELYRKAIANL